MVVSFRGLYLASRQCRRGKRKSAQCQLYEARLLDELFDTQGALQTLSWRPAPMRCFVANNGVKPREIHAPAYGDRVVHHWLTPQLVELFEPGFIYDCAANIKGRGVHFAVARLQRMFRRLGGGGCFMQLDIANFFYSIDHAVLLDILARRLRSALAAGRLQRGRAILLYRLSRLLLQPCNILTRPADRVLLAQIAPHKRLQNRPPGSHYSLVAAVWRDNPWLNHFLTWRDGELVARFHLHQARSFNDQRQWFAAASPGVALLLQRGRCFVFDDAVRRQLQALPPGLLSRLQAAPSPPSAAPAAAAQLWQAPLSALHVVRRHLRRQGAPHAWISEQGHCRHRLKQRRLRLLCLTSKQYGRRPSTAPSDHCL